MKKFLSVALLSGIFGNLSVGAVVAKGLGRVYPKLKSIEEMKEGLEGEYVENFFTRNLGKEGYPSSKIYTYAIMIIFVLVSAVVLRDYCKFKVLEKETEKRVQFFKNLVAKGNALIELSFKLFPSFRKYINDNINKPEGGCRPKAINTKCNLDEIDSLRKRFVTHYGGNLANLGRQIELLRCKVESKYSSLRDFKKTLFLANTYVPYIIFELTGLRESWSLFAVLHRGWLSEREKFFREAEEESCRFIRVSGSLVSFVEEKCKKMKEFKKQIDEQIEKMKKVSRQINKQIKNMEEFVERIGVQIRGVEMCSEQFGFNKQIEKMNIIKGQVEEMNRMKGQVVEQINEMKDYSKQIDEQCTEERNSQQSAHRDLPQDILQSPVYQFLFNA